MPIVDRIFAVSVVLVAEAVVMVVIALMVVVKYQA